MSTQNRRYVLVSAIRNEAAYIEGLIDTVAAQTVKPVRWLIVDDGSSDNTFEMAAKKVERDKSGFMEMSRMPSYRPWSFASQAYAANFGYELLNDTQFEYVGFLDADIRIGPDYYERLIEFFDRDPKLGLGGGRVVDKCKGGDRIRNQGSEGHHVAGGVQFFRRNCFEDIGARLNPTTIVRKTNE
jgi:poly-beta-1,6-N-acetyl-D-glucosamine synthase